MDLSGLKWPLIIVVIVAIVWLGTSGGVNWMISRATAAQPGVDAAQDERDEASLTRIGDYLFMLWRWEKALGVYETCIDRYGENGRNYWYTLYQVANCHDRMQNYQITYDILQELIAIDAYNKDERVPNSDNLRLRADKLKEMYDEVN
jgi:tetratricopeptide (TPR) repeat protein